MQELVTDEATNTAQHIKVQGLEISIARFKIIINGIASLGLKQTNTFTPVNNIFHIIFKLC